MGGSIMKMDFESKEGKNRINEILYHSVRQINSSGKYREVFIRGLLVEISHSVLREKVKIVGDHFLDAGFVYAPYIPLQMEPTIWEGDDFTPSLSLSSRYSATTIDNRLYGNIVVGDL